MPKRAPTDFNGIAVGASPLNIDDDGENSSRIWGRAVRGHVPAKDKQLVRVTVERNPKQSAKEGFESECQRYGRRWTYIGAEEIQP